MEPRAVLIENRSFRPVAFQRIRLGSLLNPEREGALWLQQVWP